LLGIWLVSAFWLLWIMLYSCASFCINMFSFVLAMYQRADLLSYMGPLWLAFKELPSGFQSRCILHSHQQRWGYPYQWRKLGRHHTCCLCSTYYLPEIV
jgi:hypothetical protein